MFLSSRFDQRSKGLFRLQSCLFGFLSTDPSRGDQLCEVVLSVIRKDTVSARFLDVVDLDIEVVAVGDAQARRNVKLFQTLANVL